MTNSTALKEARASVFILNQSLGWPLAIDCTLNDVGTDDDPTARRKPRLTTQRYLYHKMNRPNGQRPVPLPTLPASFIANPHLDDALHSRYFSRAIDDNKTWNRYVLLLLRTLDFDFGNGKFRFVPGW